MPDNSQGKERKWLPSWEERRKARNGHYINFNSMPRLVREWAKENGCVETKNGVINILNGREFMDTLVYECLNREVRRANNKQAVQQS